MSVGKLPEGWVDTQLGNVVEYGKTSKKDLSNVNGDTWVLELEDIEKDSSKLLDKVVASNRPFKSTKNSFKKGDILYGKLRPYLNKIIIATDDGVCTTEIIPMNAEPRCCNKYLFFWLKSSTFLGYVIDVSYGVNMPRLGTSDGLKAPLRLAPFAEQKIIAEKLDSLLAQVDSSKARLEQIPKILKRFRQAVLSTAVSGNLTVDLRNSQSLIDWHKINLGALIVDSCNGLAKRKGLNGNEVTILRLADFKNAQRINGNERKIKLDSKEQSKYSLKDNDILVIRVNGSADLAGRFIEYKTFGDIEGFCDHFIRLQLDSSKITSKFLTYIANYGEGRFYLRNSLSTSAGQNTINQTSIKGLSFLLPPLSEQREIVRRVEQLFAYADTIEKQVNNALSRVNNLTQSILAKAFRGELTAQWRAENPELISGENSAAALLEKIKAERAASSGKKTSRKKS